MKTLSHVQLSRIGQYVMDHGREIEKATWRYLFAGGSRDAILQALLPYQNGDGGFGHGLEADIQMPGSSAIASAEAILIADACGLDCDLSRQVTMHWRCHLAVKRARILMALAT